ncbi:MAG: hypothetical protein AAFV28_14075, partial [Cyanobacteria bacterium J06635_13]
LNLNDIALSLKPKILQVKINRAVSVNLQLVIVKKQLSLISKFTINPVKLILNYKIPLNFKIFPQFLNVL